MLLHSKFTPVTPDLVLVPPTPISIRPSVQPLSPSLSAISSSPAISTAPPTPELISTDQERSSSETIEIYSMYGDEIDPLHRAWSVNKKNSYGSSEYRNHSSHNSHESSAYFSAVSDSHGHNSYNAVSVSGRSTPVNPAPLSPDRFSLDSPYIGIEVEMPNDYHGPPIIHRASVHRGHSKSPPRPVPDSRYLSATPPLNRPASAVSTIMTPPPPPPSLPDPQQQQTSSPSSRPSSIRAGPTHPPSISQTTQTSGAPSPRPSGKDVSFTSLTRSEGEDDDSFLIRSTYALLEVSGVRGDGYDEGVERTRARIGTSRASEILAANAIGDELEKKRDLSSQELAILSSLDRYGFFTTPSHDRLVLLPTIPFAKPLSRVTSTSTSASTSAKPLSALPPSPLPVHEVERMEKWGRMLEPRARDHGGNIEAWAVRHNKAHKLRRRIYKGIPDRWRSAAWATLMVDFSKSSQADIKRLKEQYYINLELPSTFDVQIDLDVPRTISGHILFKTRYGMGQRSLFHVLHSFSLHCGRCGYCQGMGPIAAMLLCYFEPERAYACMVHLHDAYNMHDIFSPGFPGLLESIYVQERLMAELMPTVYAAFKKHMVSTTAYATKWYITLFANSVPFQMSLRLWDAFLLEGPDLFVVVALAIIWGYRDHITSDAANFESILSLLSSYFVPEDENALLSWISAVFEDKKLRPSMRQWRKEWKALVAAGKDGDALL